MKFLWYQWYLLPHLGWYYHFARLHIDEGIQRDWMTNCEYDSVLQTDGTSITSESIEYIGDCINR